MRQQQQDGEQPTRGRGHTAHAGPADRAAPRRRPLPQGDQHVVALAPTQQREPDDSDEREHDRLDGSERELAVQLGGDDLRGHHAEAAAEHIRGAERAQGGHEDEQRGAGERRADQRQRDPPQRRPPTGAERLRGLEHGPVELREAGAGEEVEVDVHRVRMHEEDRPRALQPPRRLFEPEDRLHRPGHEARLAVQEEEGDHPHERGQHGRERDQRPEGPPAREVEPLEQERERYADPPGEHHARDRDPDAGPQRAPFARVRDEGVDRVAIRGAQGEDRDRIDNQPGQEQRQGQFPQRPALPRGDAHDAGSAKPIIRAACT